MTLIDKLKTNVSINTDGEATRFAKQCEKIAEEFAIDFYNWMRENDIPINANKYFHYTDKDMLNAFKEEKGL